MLYQILVSHQGITPPFTDCSVITISWESDVTLRGADAVDRKVILAATAALKNTIPLVGVPISLTSSSFWIVH